MKECLEFQLYVNNNYYLKQYGELRISIKRKMIPQISLPLSSKYKALVNENSLSPM